MKKVIFALVIFASFSFATASDASISAEKVFLIQQDDCGSDASPIYSSCISGCLSIHPRLTGSLAVDVNRLPRKPTAAEYQVIQEMLNEICDS
jgi:hypothetical protein